MAGIESRPTDAQIYYQEINKVIQILLPREKC
jgi:hypothetical protein